MTTKQLIERLQQLPQDATVFVDATNGAGDNIFCVLTLVDSHKSDEVNDVYLIADDNVERPKAE